MKETHSLDCIVEVPQVSGGEPIIFGLCYRWLAHTTASYRGQRIKQVHFVVVIHHLGDVQD